LSRRIDGVAETAARQATTAQEVLSSASVLAVAARSTASSAKSLATASERIERVTDLLGAAAVAESGAPEAAAALSEIAQAMRPVFDVPREHAGRFLALVEVTAGTVSSGELKQLDLAMTNNLATFRAEVCGVTVTVTPGLLDDRALWMHWWVNDGSTQKQLLPDLDPLSATFYDYTVADWYTTPTQREATWLSDPYYDDGGANADIVTISVPAAWGGELIGVATADIDLDQIGELCSPALRRIGRPAALVTATGVVVASTEADLLPAGKPLPDRTRDWLTATCGAWTDGPDGAAVARTPTLDWALLLL